MTGVQAAEAGHSTSEDGSAIYGYNTAFPPIINAVVLVLDVVSLVALYSLGAGGSRGIGRDPETTKRTGPACKLIFV